MSHRIIRRLATLALTACALSTLHAADAPSWQVDTLKVERHGSGGHAVILIPGLAGGAWVWKDTVADLEKRDTVYVVTLAGFDGTSPPSGDGQWLDRADDALARLIADRHIAHPILVGHSLGGTLALRFAGRHPDLVGGVVAVDGLPVFPGMERVDATQRAAIAGGLRAQMESATPEAFQAQQLQYMKSVGTLDPSIAERVAPLNARSDRKAVARYMAEDVGADFRPDLKAAKAPILEIMPYSQADANAGPVKLTQAQKTAYYASLLADAPNARVVPIAPSRHYVMLDQPATFLKTLNAFIEAH
ncbi:alpha/beta fold hydrolase [Luteibacter sahnii]|uniref:alpha/beta fold hydrolase n=1 Tax=Luteibacter sahnii TaxID=3021977 RepID=UPI002A6B8872|nr:alpha/beta hydrolase [Luteibacter sp. PPL193]MDY1549025.1 alpha/beta hydrolase [Luteibacter sp. PPL193]